MAAVAHPLYNFGYLPVGPRCGCFIYQRVVHLFFKPLLKRGITRLLHVLISVNVRGFVEKLLFLGYVSRNMRTAAASRNVLGPFHVFVVILERICYLLTCWHAWSYLSASSLSWPFM